MLRFHRLWVAAALVLLCGTSHAADIVIRKNDGSSYRIPIAANARLKILPGQGGAEIQPATSSGTAGDGWCPSAPPTFSVAFTVTPSFASAYQVVTVNWVAQNATSCSSTGSTYPSGVTSLTGWTASLPTAGANRQVTLNKAGTYNFKITCTGPGGSISANRAVSAQ